MKQTLLGWLVALLALACLPARAQDNVWLQIAARPGQAAAEAVAANYARQLDRVSGFRLGSTNWYAIVLGPFSVPEAQARQRDLRAAGLIPGDAFTTDGTSFRGQFWPRSNRRAEPERTAPAPPPPALQPGEESPAAARLSERRLTAAERRRLQTALRWAGVYDAAIDGAFGRGTRTAMADWQAGNDFERTGVLTTAQRAALLGAYDAVLEDLGLETVRDETAGITIVMPTAWVSFDRYEPPFAHYPARDVDDEAQAILISQPGDRTTLAGLYDVMQTLEIVPPEGRRERRAQSFSLLGRDDDIVSQTEAWLVDGAVKGFTLVWPADDEARRQRLVDEMAASFTPLPGRVLDPGIAAPDEEQAIDLLAGLALRRPRVSRSGFYVTTEGDVLTTADATQGCRRITLDADVEARLAGIDRSLGLALLAPSEPLAPRAHARFRASVPRLQSDAILAGFSYDGALGAPSLSYGTLADLRGLDGEDEVKRFAIEARSGDAGGPVLDQAGGVLGMLLPGPDAAARALPEGTAFAVDVEPVMAFLAANGHAAETASETARLPRAAIEARAKDMTVLVGCWD